jgi:O-methyltransferase involved in polyketide biosynthesis
MQKYSWHKYLFLSIITLYFLVGVLNIANSNKLENLLTEKRWFEADKRTTEAMLRISRREVYGKIDVDSFEKINCHDLSQINSLWLKYSQNHFGFTIQKEILDNLQVYYHGDFDTTFEKFANKVGWISKDDTYQHSYLKFDLSAAKGELPSFDWMQKTTPMGWPWNWQGKHFFDRIRECQI